MYFKQILNEDCGCASYIVASRDSHECAVVDPALDIQPYLEVMADRAMTLRYIIDTHLHADHVSGNRRLSGETGVPVSLHEAADVVFPFEKLRDRHRLELGLVTLEVLHTPGHRPESISLLITNPPRSSQPSMVLTGDCLFVGDVGRPDFGGPNAAAQQYDSSHRLLELEDYVEVFPAHFEGSCGRGMCGRPSSTIGFELRFNPMLQLPASSPVHRHNAHAYVYMLEGSVLMQIKGGKQVTLKPGQTFYEAPDDVHVIDRNASKTKPAKFLVVLIKEKGAPALVPVK